MTDTEVQTVRRSLPTLTELATEINQEHTQCGAAFLDSTRHARNAGGMLIEAKGRVQHGEWADWIKENVTFSERTAQLYMCISRKWPEIEAQLSATPVADFSVRQIQGLLAAPAENDGRSARAKVESVGPEAREVAVEIVANEPTATVEAASDTDTPTAEVHTTTEEPEEHPGYSKSRKVRRSPDGCTDRALGMIEVAIQTLAYKWDDADQDRWRPQLRALRRSISRLLNGTYDNVVEEGENGAPA